MAIGRDFNELLSNSGKKGKLINKSHSSEFLDIINHCDLLDLGFKGSKYTWLNEIFNHNNALILERLDKILVTNDWLLQYPNTHVMHLPHTHLDHCHLLLTLFHDDPTLRKRSFKLEKIWTNHPKFRNVVALGKQPHPYACCP